MSNSPVGDVELGKYFNIEFPGYTNSPNATPILSYGKHIFKITINQNTRPKIKAGTKVLFEFKDSGGLVLFSEIVPITNPGNLQFTGYVWIKKQPLGTYDSPGEGTGTMTIAAVTETNDSNWKDKFNVRSVLDIELDLTIQQTIGGAVQTYYPQNKSPIVFKDTSKMASGSGLFISELVRAVEASGSYFTEDTLKTTLKINTFLEKYFW